MKHLQQMTIIGCLLLAGGCDQSDEKPRQNGQNQQAQGQPAPARPVPDAAAKGAMVAEGFSIVPPAGWEPGEARDKTFMVYLDKPKDKFRANFNVNVNPDDGTPMEKIGSLVKPMFAKQFQKWQPLEEGKITISGESCYYLSSRFNMQGNDIQNLQYYIRGKNKRMYVLTFTAKASNYKSYEPIFKQAAATIQTRE